MNNIAATCLLSYIDFKRIKDPLWEVERWEDFLDFFVCSLSWDKSYEFLEVIPWNVKKRISVEKMVQFKWLEIKNEIETESNSANFYDTDHE